jgi:GTP-binding protein
MFVDEAVILVESGKGGDGIVHFLREKYRPRGGPDGGDGGRGGNVIFEVTPHLNTLMNFRFQREFKADDGKNGSIKKQTGASADDLVILVPPGTIIYNAQTNELIGDLTDEGQQLLIAKGGRGGRGNVHFMNSRNQAPRTAERGEPGEQIDLRLELRLIADVGLVGVPNAGKSSMLAASTNAKPKIADYPFTTLEPNLGVVELDIDHNLVLADIPGLIEGAHMGVGLGDAFLRHVQRTRILIHVLDGISEDPLLDFNQINAELALFDEALGEKPQIVVMNKVDLPDAQAMYEMLKPEFQKLGYELHPVSAVAHTNLKQILWKAYHLLQELPEPEHLEKVPVYRVEEDPREFTIEVLEEGVYNVSGKSIERAAAMTWWDQPGSIRRFQRLLEILGIDAELRNEGILPGDTVQIGEYELEWQD